MKEKDIFVIAASLKDEDDEHILHEEEMNAIVNLENDVKDGFRRIQQKAASDKDELLSQIRSMI